MVYKTRTWSHRAVEKRSEAKTLSLSLSLSLSIDMILRSASVPTLGALVTEAGDRHDCSPLNQVAHRSRQGFLSINSGSHVGLSLKPSFAMRRACSETDLQGLLSSADAMDDRNAGEKARSHSKRAPHSFEKLSVIEERDQTLVSLEDGLTPPLIEKDLQSRSRACSGMFSSHTYMPYGHACCTTAADMESLKSEGELGGKGGNGSGHDGYGRWSESSYGDSDSTELRYIKLLQSDPGNPLLLRNYAQYLSETKNDYKKSEEYYERAILACPSDGEVLSTYARLLWDVHKDAERAGSYYTQAVNAAPDDCYVLASHASFLWQTEEDDEECADASKPLFPSSNSLCATTPSLTASA